MKTLIGGFILFLLASPSVYSFENGLKPFETDGCTMFIDGPPSQPTLWRHCCVEHDMRYWFGGDYQDRDKTDLRLKSCVQNVAGEKWAELIYEGVRIGHSSPIKNKTTWGWGWETERQNTKLTTEESNYVIADLRRLPYDQKVNNDFIKRNFPNNYVEL